MHSLRIAGSLSAAHTVATGAGTLRVLVISIACPSVRGCVRRLPEAPAGLRALERCRERCQAVEIVYRQKIVDMRKHRLDPGRARLEAFVTQQRIEPDESTAGFVQPLRLPAE